MSIRVRKHHTKSETSMISARLKTSKESSRQGLDTSLQSNTLPLQGDEIKGKFNNLLWFIQKTMDLPKPSRTEDPIHPNRSLDFQPSAFSDDPTALPSSNSLYMNSYRKKYSPSVSQKQLRLRQLSNLGRRIFE